MGLFDSAFFTSMVVLTVPLLWASLGELVSERSGVLNIGIEGMVIVGAFCAYYVAYVSGSAWLGVLAAVGGGLLVAVLMAYLSVSAGSNQIIVGIGLYIAAAGAAEFAFRQLFTNTEQTPAPTLAAIRIPLLDEIPLVGHALFEQGPLIYMAYVAVPLVYFLLWRTRWGLVVRASGEEPEAVAAGGASVLRARWSAVLVAGIGGGLAGAALTVGALGVYSDGVSGGIGFLSIAAVLFGRWKPFGVLAACLLFGGAEALQLSLQAIHSVPVDVWIAAGIIALLGLLWMLYRHRSPAQLWTVGAALLIALLLVVVQPSISLPSQFWLMFPYVLVLLVLAGLVGRSRVPSALGHSYRGEDASGA